MNNHYPRACLTSWLAGAGVIGIETDELPPRPYKKSLCLCGKKDLMRLPGPPQGHA